MSKNSLIAIVFAAGRGSRLVPFTDTTPKPLATVNGKTLLEWDIEKIQPAVSKIIIVISYLGQQIIDTFGSFYKETPIEYVWQKNNKGGTLDALRSAIFYSNKDTQKADYIVLNGDEIHGPEIYTEMLSQINKDRETALVSAKIFEDKEKLKNFGVYEVDSSQYMIKVWEKPEQYVSNLVNNGIYFLPNKVIDFIDDKLNESTEHEHYITRDLFNPYLLKYKIKVVSSSGMWLPISNLADLESARKMLGHHFHLQKGTE